MTVVTLIGASALDLLIGDPRWLLHPVRAIGAFVAWGESRFSRHWVRHPRAARFAGVGLAVGFPVLSYLVAWSAIVAADVLHAGTMMEMALAFSALASRDLADHALAVRNALQTGLLEEGRTAVSRIVGRDTQDLPEGEIVRATVETVAESTCDGIVAPLLFLAVGGAPLAWAYKTVSTLDSMIGHKEPPYRDVGWASARLDDVLNWIPARVTALLLLGAAGIRFLSRHRISEGWRTLLRDGGKHPSPNSGRPEAAMAGVLRITLGGVNRYDGRSEERPLIGMSSGAMGPDRITEAVGLMWMVFALAVGVACGILWWAA